MQLFAQLATTLSLCLSTLAASAYTLDFSGLALADGQSIPDTHGDVPAVVDVDLMTIDNAGSNVWNHLRYKASAGSLAGVAYTDHVPSSNPPGWGQIVLRPLDENKAVKVTSFQIISLSGTRSVPVGAYDPVSGLHFETTVSVGTSPVTVSFNNFEAAAGSAVLVYWRGENGQVAIDNVVFDVAAASRTIYYVETTGSDAVSRDGLTAATAWKTLSYACSRVPAGPNTIKLGAGTFQEMTVSRVKTGVAIVGNGDTGASRTTVLAPSAWNFLADGCGNNFDGYIIRAQNAQCVTIRDIEFRDEFNADTNGAIIIEGGSHWAHIHRVSVADFRYAGIYVRLSNGYDIHDSYFENASGANYCDASELASITTLWTSSGQIHDNQFFTLNGHGYGVRARGGTQTRIFNNVFDGDGNFDIEIAHENEFGVEIFNNFNWGPVSLPKSGDNANPNPAGYTYSIRAHHNISASSYTFEGPRGFVEIDHNFSNQSRGQGRFYQDHGGNVSGPFWIHHNVVENVSLNFVWVVGPKPNIHIYNNTVYDDGKNLFSFIDIWDSASTGCVIKNNIFVNPGPVTQLVTSPIRSSFDITNNVVIGADISWLPAGTDNVSINPGLNLSGSKPYPYFAPAAANSYVVDRGVDVGYPYVGAGPDIGAFEWGGAWEDFGSPWPDPAEWVVVPVAASATSITMEAYAVDLGGVEYYFEETSGNPGGSDSGWISSPSYTDVGLDDAFSYSYRVKARDASHPAKEGAWSGIVSMKPADITFHDLGVADGDDIPATHGDVPGQLDVQYRGTNLAGATLGDYYSQGNAVNLWGLGYGDLRNVAYGSLNSGEGIFAEIALVPFAGYQVTLHSLKIAGYEADQTGIQVRVVEDGVGVRFDNQYTAPGTGHALISPQITSTKTLRIQVEAAGGNVGIDDIQYTVAPAGTASPNWTVITYDDFEAGWGSYTDGGIDCTRYIGTVHSHQGAASANIQNSGGAAASFYTTTGRNVAGFTRQRVKFWYKTLGMRTNEGFVVEYSSNGGGTWQTVKRFGYPADFLNQQFYAAELVFENTQFSFTSNARLRFRCDASSTRDDVYIDEIEWAAQ
jgi:hypothetical protein